MMEMRELGQARLQLAFLLVDRPGKMPHKATDEINLLAHFIVGGLSVHANRSNTRAVCQLCI